MGTGDSWGAWRGRVRPFRRYAGVVLAGLLVVTAAVAGGAVRTAGAVGARPAGLAGFEVQSLDGSGNNRAHPEWGQADTAYLRLAPAQYADGLGVPVDGPNPRYVSNRVFNDTGQSLFSGRGVSQWGTTWGQFLDHTFGQRADGDEDTSIPFASTDPLETFTNDLGIIFFNRSAVAPGTGVSGPREQPNLISSYLDAWAVYGGSADRLEWLREGPVDGDLSNNGARLLLPGGLLPRRDARGDAESAPEMDATNALPERVVVAGDTRANENVALTGVQTLFAREHNRIVSLLPGALTEEQKFQIARRIVIATQQWITYTQFLPSLGVRLAPYRGYRPDTNATLGNEFATVGYRAHSMLRGDVTVRASADRYTAAELATLRARGATVTPSPDGRRVTIVVPPELALFHADLVPQLRLGPLLQGIGEQPQAANDELVANLVRSVRLTDPECERDTGGAGCLRAVFDVTAVDLARGRDHGMPSYNELRRAYGLAPKPSFRAITGEAGEAFPADPALTPGAEADDPDSLDFLRLFDADGRLIPPGSDRADTSAVAGVRRTPLAARLRAAYGSVSTMDAFAGMLAEPRVPGSELGELQLAIWQRQFTDLRDGDRFFYGNDPGLRLIQQRFGIGYRHTLSDLIALNTDIPRSALPGNVFLVGAGHRGG